MLHALLAWSAYAHTCLCQRLTDDLMGLGDCWQVLQHTLGHTRLLHCCCPCLLAEPLQWRTHRMLILDLCTANNGVQSQSKYSLLGHLSTGTEDVGKSLCARPKQQCWLAQGQQFNEP
jgi:hypothetical protein